MSEIAPGISRDLQAVTDTKKAGLLKQMFSALKDGVDLLCNIRGVGYDFGTGNGLRTPKIVKLEHNRFAWITETLRDIAVNYIWIDAAVSFAKLQPWAPTVGDPSGGRLRFALIAID
jgi:hypothetical protein